MDELVKNSGFEKMILDIEALVNASKNELATSINKVMTVTYWNIGKYIVEFEQDGNAKAAYGKNLLSTISKELTLRLGKGYSRPNLNNMRKFYLKYSNCQTVSDKLSWSHICELIKIDDELERNFYEKECVVENWNVRTLRRQMDSALFLRLASSRDKEGILKLAQNGIDMPYLFVKSWLPKTKINRTGTRSASNSANHVCCVNSYRT